MQMVLHQFECQDLYLPDKTARTGKHPHPRTEFIIVAEDVLHLCAVCVYVPVGAIVSECFLTDSLFL